MCQQIIFLLELVIDMQILCTGYRNNSLTLLVLIILVKKLESKNAA